MDTPSPVSLISMTPSVLADILDYKEGFCYSGRETAVETKKKSFHHARQSLGPEEMPLFSEFVSYLDIEVVIAFELPELAPVFASAEDIGPGSSPYMV